MGNATEETQVNPRECRICIEDYDPVTRRPRFLPCGHTFCTECINDMLEDSVLTCPNCRAEHKAFNVNDFPVASIVEDFLMYCLFLEKGKIPKFEPEESKDSLDNRNSENGSLCRMMDTLRDEELACSRTLISSSNFMLSELQRYRGYILGFKKDHQIYQENFQKVIDLHNAAIGLLEDEIMAIDVLKDKGAKEKQVLLSAVNSLLSARTSEEVETAIVKVDDHQHTMEKWFQECSIIPDHDAICVSVKLRNASSEVLETLCSWLDGNPLDKTTIADYAKSTSNLVLRQNFLQPECLFDFTNGLFEKFIHYFRKYQSVIPANSITAYVEAGHSVCAVKFLDSDFRFGRFSESSGNTFLHCLRKQPPNSGLYTIPFGKLAVKEFQKAWKVFFDISWLDLPHRRVIIDVEANIPMDCARVLFSLCTGERGQTYINNGVLMAGDEESDELIILGKDSSDPGASAEFAKERLVQDAAGLMSVGVNGRIGITINPATDFFTPMGKVFSGMDVLREVWDLEDASSVKVVDCGIVLPR